MQILGVEQQKQAFDFQLLEEELKEILFLLKEKDSQNPLAQKLIQEFNTQSEVQIVNHPMSYGQFTLRTAIERFDLTDNPELSPVLFQEVQKIEPSAHLREVLKQNKIIPAISEKARSETIITPILVETAQRNKGNFNVLSGERMDVDSERGLVGECDYIFHTFSSKMVLLEPVFALVEAKKGIIEDGLGQCVAQMVGARELNQSKNKVIPTIYGCVTNAKIWKFLKLEDNQLIIDDNEYYISEIDIILGIFQVIVDGFLKNRESSETSEDKT